MPAQAIVLSFTGEKLPCQSAGGIRELPPEGLRRWGEGVPASAGLEATDLSKPAKAGDPI